VAGGYAALAEAAAAAGLDIFGAFHPEPGDGVPAGTGTLVLLGPLEPGFWARFTAGPEYADGAADPLDRWTARVVGALAREQGAVALLPFGGPPFLPFLSWAVKSGRAWASPVGLLVHDRAGLMVSYRGALALPRRIELPPAAGARPCDGCPDRPCLSACPAGALGAAGYDTAACRAYLSSGPGRACMEGGCAVRAACPVSRGHGRLAVQSAFHMRAFHKG
jgi:hypothetical protein